MQIQKSTEFDLSKISFSDITKNKFGGKKVYVSFEEKDLYIQLPQVVVPFGINEYSKENGDSTYSISFSLNAKQSDKIKDTLENLHAFDELIKKTGKENCKLWLGKRELPDVVNDEIFKSNIKPGVESGMTKYPDTFKCNLYKNNKGNFTCPGFIKENGKMTTVDIEQHLTKGVKCIPVLKCNGVWFGFGGYGVSWIVAQMQIFPKCEITQPVFLDEESDDESYEASM